MRQEVGLVGRSIGSMIRRSVKRRYRNVYWRGPVAPISSPAILYANHHSWMDGYLMFHLAKQLKLVCVDWIEEFDTFPLFGFVGGIRFPKHDVPARVAAIRRTIDEMKKGRSLVIFPEGVLHRPPEILPLGKAIATISKRVPNVVLVPVAIYQEISMHERPEAWISVGNPHSFESLDQCHGLLESELSRLRADIAQSAPFDVLASGTPSVNERFSMRRFRPK